MVNFKKSISYRRTNNYFENSISELFFKLKILTKKKKQQKG